MNNPPPLRTLITAIVSIAFVVMIDLNLLVAHPVVEGFAVVETSSNGNPQRRTKLPRNRHSPSSTSSRWEQLLVPSQVVVACGRHLRCHSLSAESRPSSAAAAAKAEEEVRQQEGALQQQQQQQEPRTSSKAPATAEEIIANDLIPSQVLNGRFQKKEKKKKVPANDSDQGGGTAAAPVSPSAAANSDKNATRMGNPHRSGKGRRRPKKKKKSKGACNGDGSGDAGRQQATISSENESGSETKATGVVRDQFPRSGNFPDVFWRAVTMEDLRQHPNFEPLPPPRDIIRLDELEHVRQFRQDSWQWDVARRGRCTTSCAAAALGFLESMQGELLNVPKSWRSRGGARSAFVKMRAEPIRTLERMNEVLCCGDEGDEDLEGGSIPRRKHESSEHRRQIWDAPISENGQPSSPFVALYNAPPSSEADLKQRKNFARRFSTCESVKPVRLAWGNAQEATALLTALNHFAGTDPGVVLREVGMCGAGLPLNATKTTTSAGGDTDDSPSQLLIGASPDGVLCYPDGRIEAVEVKNHCPFFTPFVKKGKSRPNRHRFVVGDREFQDESVFPHLIPQLMMEMLCLGPECRSAVMVRQTATRGALLLRLRRDDDWIGEMLYFLGRFKSEFVDAAELPPPNFFLLHSSREDTARYRRFLNKTLEIRNRVEVVSRIEQDMIQRAAEGTSLFL